MLLKSTITIALITAAMAGPSGAFQLPKEVTPQMRAACEKDVRRLCIHKGATVASVKACVRRKFSKLNARCKMQLAFAGFSK